jgi:hypothetical protein
MTRLFLLHLLRAAIGTNRRIAGTQQISGKRTEADMASTSRACRSDAHDPQPT